jgi:hypothetical protein
MKKLKEWCEKHLTASFINMVIALILLFTGFPLVMSDSLVGVVLLVIGCYLLTLDLEVK